MGDKAQARRYAELEFITMSRAIPSKNEKEVWIRVGLTPTPDLYRQQGDYHLTKGTFWAAFDAYKAAGNETGMSNAVAGMLTPLPPEDSE